MKYISKRNLLNPETPIAKKIGILGGSFNPAHGGHVYISEKALELLGLDEIWWLISPQNPLKESSITAPLKTRMEKAQKIASTNPKIKVSDFETHSGTIYTYDTISALKAKYPGFNFTWLMGADNMLQFPKWHKWREIAQLVPIAVFNRDSDTKNILNCQFATEFKTNMVQNPIELPLHTPPAWIFLDIEPNPLSSTRLREEGLNS